MEDDVTAYALEALAAGGGPAAAAVAQALASATAAGDAFGQARALVALAAVCATAGARDAVDAGAVEAAVDALDSAPAHALQCLADCVRACPAAAAKATRAHVLHCVLRAAERCAGDVAVAYAATALVAAIVAEEHVAAAAVPLVVAEGALVLLHDALEAASDAADFKLAIAALRAAGDIAQQCNCGVAGADDIRAQMIDIGLVAAALRVFADMFPSVLVRDAALAFVTAACKGSPECAEHFGELSGGDGIRLVLSAARRVGRPVSAPPSTTAAEPAVQPAAPLGPVAGHGSYAGDIPAPQCPVEPAVPREQSTELHRKTADALAQITVVERNCGVIRSLRGVSTIVSLVAHVAHSARHVEAALISLDRCVSNSQFAARDAYHAAASSVIVVAMQRHRHRGSVQACAIRCLIALTELYDCHRQAACRASAVQAAYFALTEHGRSAEIVNLACTFLLLLSPCDILSNQICMNDLLRVVVMRKETNSQSAEVQNSATNLVEAIQFIPGDILRRVEAQVVAQPKSVVSGVRSSGSLSSIAAVSGAASGSLSGLGSSESSLRKSWRRRAQTSSSLRSSSRGFGRVPGARLSFPGLGRSDNDTQASQRVQSSRGPGELHHHVEDDLLAGIDQGPEAFLMRQTLGRTLESARKPDADFDDGLSLDEAGLEETLATTAALLPDLTGGGLGSTGAIGTVGATPVPAPIQTATHVGSSASSEPASPPWTQWPVAALSNDGGESDRALSPLPTLADLPRPVLQRFDLGRGSGLGTEPSSIVSLDPRSTHLAPYHVMVTSGMPPTLSRGETGSL